MAAKHSTIIEVKRRNNETPLALIRRFSRKVQQAGVVKKVRASQFRTRPFSDKKRKEKAMRKQEQIKRMEYLKKIGRTDRASR